MQPMLPSWWRRIRRFWLLFPIFLRFLKEEEEERTEGAPSRRREKEWAGRSEEDRSTCHAQAKRTLRYLSFFPHLHCTLQSEKARGGRQRSIHPASQPAFLAVVILPPACAIHIRLSLSPSCLSWTLVLAGLAATPPNTPRARHCATPWRVNNIPFSLCKGKDSHVAHLCNLGLVTNSQLLLS